MSVVMEVKSATLAGDLFCLLGTPARTRSPCPVYPNGVHRQKGRSDKLRYGRRLSAPAVGDYYDDDDIMDISPPSPSSLGTDPPSLSPSSPGSMFTKLPGTNPFLLPCKSACMHTTDIVDVSFDEFGICTPNTEPSTPPISIRSPEFQTPNCAPNCTSPPSVQRRHERMSPLHSAIRRDSPQQISAILCAPTSPAQPSKKSKIDNEGGKCGKGPMADVGNGRIPIHPLVYDSEDLPRDANQQLLDVDGSWVTPMWAAARMRKLRACMALEDCGADPLAVNDEGQTCLHALFLQKSPTFDNFHPSPPAIYRDPISGPIETNTCTLQLLVDFFVVRGVDELTRDCYGRTVADYAHSVGCDDCASWLSCLPDLRRRDLLIRGSLGYGSSSVPRGTKRSRAFSNIRRSYLLPRTSLGSAITRLPQGVVSTISDFLADQTDYQEFLHRCARFLSPSSNLPLNRPPISSS